MTRPALYAFSSVGAWLAVVVLQAMTGHVEVARALYLIGGGAFVGVFLLFGHVIFARAPTKHRRRDVDDKVARRIRSMYDSSSMRSSMSHFRLRSAPSSGVQTGISILIVFCISAVMGATIGLLQTQQYIMAIFTLIAGTCGLVAGVLLGWRYDRF
ncbi:hypothetical protein [Rhizobium sp. FY34]|uniref:hypothetical protein n=1 Tax=Rhizobium sp. FY34 TaxID=2562309 RepID=UPI0010C0FBA2|nr:hypothetical protein [Rhizobium sp. FY34]